MKIPARPENSWARNVVDWMHSANYADFAEALGTASNIGASLRTVVSEHSEVINGNLIAIVYGPTVSGAVIDPLGNIWRIITPENIGNNLEDVSDWLRAQPREEIKLNNPYVTQDYQPTHYARMNFAGDGRCRSRVEHYTFLDSFGVFLKERGLKIVGGRVCDERLRPSKNDLIAGLDPM